MSHLLDDNHTNGVHIAPTYPHERFKTVLRMPRQHATTRPPNYRQVQSVDTIGPALLLGCMVLSAITFCLIVFAAIQLGRQVLEAVRHAGGF